VLNDSSLTNLDEEQTAALRRARAFLGAAEVALNDKPVRNDDGWAAYHAARRESIRLREPDDLALMDIDLGMEAEEKLGAWRRKAVDRYLEPTGAPPTGRQVSGDRIGPVARLTRVQRHLDEAVENEARTRRLQRTQLIVYLFVIAVVLALLIVIEFTDRGLLLRDAEESLDGWWAVDAFLYGTLGGAFSAAQRVAAAGADAQYPDKRWQIAANAFRAFVGGAAALVALAALRAGLLGDDAVTGPRVAVISFAAGFTERFISALTK
jgi:hypothetical protein